MSEICTKCGLPKDICTCESIAKEEKKIRISTVARRFGKITTLISGISKDVDIKNVLKKLKTGLACGGTLKGGEIELQGNHRDKVKPLLVKMGFPEDQIQVG
jgi:translation initiation factor 1